MRTKETTVGGLQYPQTSMGLMKNIESTMYIAPGRMKFQNKIEYCFLKFAEVHLE